jgi:hypothetical protein
VFHFAKLYVLTNTTQREITNTQCPSKACKGGGGGGGI